MGKECSGGKERMGKECSGGRERGGRERIGRECSGRKREHGGQKRMHEERAWGKRGHWRGESMEGRRSLGGRERETDRKIMKSIVMAACYVTMHFAMAASQNLFLHSSTDVSYNDLV
jgi:hypothetical protein